MSCSGSNQVASSEAQTETTMAEAPAAAGDGHGDAGVEEVVGQLEGLHIYPELPAPLQRPEVQRVDTGGRRFVCFDLETTGLSPRSHITQIAACSGEGETFSSYVLPQIPIDPKAEKITGITCQGQQMRHHGNPVPCLTIRPALEGFIDFLGDGSAVVIGHNIQHFDCPVLLNALQACGLVERFQRAVHGCVDSLPLFRKINTEVPNHKLGTLYEYYTGKDFQAHDAREDVRALQQIVDEASPDEDTFRRHSFTFEHIIEVQRYNAARAEVSPAWMELVRKKVISKYIADKAAGQGLRWEDVVLTFQRDGESRVRVLLRDRLTNRTGTIDKLFQHLRGNAPDNP